MTVMFLVLGCFLTLMCPWPEVLCLTWITPFGDLHAWQNLLALSREFSRSSQISRKSLQIPSVSTGCNLDAEVKGVGVEGGGAASSSKVILHKERDRLKMHHTRMKVYVRPKEHELLFIFTWHITINIKASLNFPNLPAGLITAEFFLIVSDEVSVLVSILSVNHTTAIWHAISENVDKSWRLILIRSTQAPNTHTHPLMLINFKTHHLLCLPEKKKRQPSARINQKISLVSPGVSCACCIIFFH